MRYTNKCLTYDGQNYGFFFLNINFIIIIYMWAGTNVLVSWHLLANWDNCQWRRKAPLRPLFLTPLQRAIDTMGENQNQVNVSEMQTVYPFLLAHVCFLMKQTEYDQ